MSESHAVDSLPPRFAQFVAGMTALVDAHAPEPRIVEEGGNLLRELLAQDDWLDPQYAQPDTEYYRQYLLYCDPAARFSVVSFVWGPGQRTPLHNHTVWGLAGILCGAEVSQEFRADAAGHLQAHGAPVRLEPGTVCAVSPTLGDIHQVFNAYDDRVSVGVHVYGADIGAVDREVFTLDGGSKPFRSKYANPANPA